MTLEGCAREVLRTYLVILLGSLFELEGVNGASRPERGPKLPLKEGHLHNCQFILSHFGIQFGTKNCAFSTSSRVRFQGSLWKAFWTSAGTIRSSRRCSGACNIWG